MSDGWEKYQKEEQKKRDEGVYKTVLARFGIAEGSTFVVQAPDGKKRSLPMRTVVSELIKMIEGQL